MDTLRIYRIIDGITDPGAILKDIDATEGRAVRVGRSLLGMLYVKPTEARPAGWLKYFGTSVDLQSLTLTSASTAAILLVKRPGGMFALSFGYGRYLLNDDAIEPRFGLKATLNAIDESQIRSIDHRRLDAVARHTREQVSRLSRIGSFGVDVARDLLRAVTGKPTDPTLGAQMAGGDVLAVTGKIPLKGIAEYLDRCEALARGTGYRASFPWVDNIAEVQAGTTRGELNQHLVESIRGGQRIGLGVPEILDWADLTGFRFEERSDAPAYPNLELADFITSFGPIDRLVITDLKHCRVFLGEAGADTSIKSWSVFRCLVAELTWKGKLYILSEGSWYQVSGAYRQQVESAVAGIGPTTTELPGYAGQAEGAWNERAANRSKGQLALMDRKLISCGNRSKVEGCDLFSTDGTLAHVKRKGASSALSHLFAQGQVAGEMFLSDSEFRKEFFARVPGPMRPADPTATPNPATHEVAYVVLDSVAPATSLPFFSKVTLRNAAQALGRLGFKVTLTGIATKRN